MSGVDTLGHFFQEFKLMLKTKRLTTYLERLMIIWTTEGREREKRNKRLKSRN
jgi:hypothetical protein